MPGANALARNTHRFGKPARKRATNVADEEKTEERAPAPAPKKSKKGLVIIALVVVLLLGGGAGAFFMFKGKKTKAVAAPGTVEKLKEDAEKAKTEEEPAEKSAEKGSEEKASEEKSSAEAKGEEGKKAEGAAGKEGEKAGDAAADADENSLIYKMEPVTANLNEDKVLRLVSVKFALEARDKAALKEIKQNVHRLTDAYITLLGNKTQAELKPEQGKDLLKMEAMERTDQILGKGKVVYIGFDQFVIVKQ